MKGETQATHLTKMMQKHQLHPEYELVLPLVLVKKKSLKKLTTGDILLLGLESLELILLCNGEFSINVLMSETRNSRKIRIEDIDEKPIYSNDSKKYKILKCSFGMLQSRKLEVGHKIDVSSLNMHEVLLIVESKIIAKGSLVNVDKEIAIQIDEVKK